MAIIKDDNLSGSISKLVFYTVDGQKRVRSKPGRRGKKRGRTPDPNNSLFGKVSGNGSRMLTQLKPYLLFPLKLQSYNNSRGWIRNQYAAHINLPEWDMYTRPNDMCQFNPAADLRDMLFFSITVKDNGGGKLQVSIPGINPVRDMKKMPPKTTSINLKLFILHSPFGENPAAGISMEQYHFGYANTQLPAKEIMINTNAPAGNLAILVVAVEPVIPDQKPGVAFLPAAVLAMGRVRD